MAIYVTIDLPATPSQLVAFLSGAVELVRPTGEARP